MPNAAYDDEDPRIGDDELRGITGNDAEDDTETDTGSLSPDDLADREADTETGGYSGAEQKERSKVKPDSAKDSGFNYRTEAKSFLKSTNANSSSVYKKTGVIVGIGVLGLIGILIVMLIGILSQLKVIHFGELLSATGYARFNGIMQERTTQNIFDASVVEGEGSVRANRLVDRFSVRNAANQVSQLGRDGKFKIELENDRLTKVKFEGGEVSIDGISKKLGFGESYEKLGWREKLTVRSEFSSQLQTQVGENLALEPRYVQGRVFSVISEKVGFKFQRWRNVGRDLLGKKPVEAIAEDNINSNKEISQGEVESGVSTIDEAAKEYNNEDRIRANIEENGGVLNKQALETAVQEDITKAAGLQEVASKISIGAMALSAACMANLTFSNVDKLAEENEKSASLMGLQPLAALDQTKQHKLTNTAYTTAAAQLNGAEQGAAYPYQTNQPVNLDKAEQPKIAPATDPTYADMFASLTSPSNYSGIGFVVGLFPGGDALKKDADKKFCEHILSPQGMAEAAALDIAVMAIVGTLTGGGEVAAEEVAGQATVRVAVKALGEALFSTGKSLVSAEGIAKGAGTAVAFGGYSLILQYVAMAFSGSTFSGSEQGAAYYDRAAVGTNVLQNRQVRSQYGRPMTDAEARGGDAHYATVMRNGWNQKGLTQRYFAAENPFSLVGMASVYAPTNATGGLEIVRKGISTLGSALNPLSLASKLGIMTPVAKAYAADSYNPYGDQIQWGFSPDELNKMRNDPSYTITENEKHITPQQISTLDGTIGKCFDPATSQYSVNKGIDRATARGGDCGADKLGTDEAFRYRLYKLDESIIATNQEDLSKPDDGPTPAASSPDTTTQAGTDAVGYENGVQKNIKIVTVNDTNGKPVLKVNSEIADNITKLIAAAKQAGLTLSSDSTFRTMEEQQYLWDCYQTKQCNNGSQAAKPGYSNHQMGYALDFVCDNAAGSDASFAGTGCFAWLQRYANQYGLKNLASEAWHWSKDGN